MISLPSYSVSPFLNSNSCIQSLPAPNGEPPSNEILLYQGDFEFALHGYSAAALRDVPLHSAGELGWEDVGGLKAVKQDLIETLELPAKVCRLTLKEVISENRKWDPKIMSL